MRSLPRWLSAWLERLADREGRPVPDLAMLRMVQPQMLPAAPKPALRAREGNGGNDSVASGRLVPPPTAHYFSVRVRRRRRILTSGRRVEVRRSRSTRRDRRERPRRDGRERDNQVAEEDGTIQHPSHVARPSLADQRRPEASGPARQPGPPQGRRPGAIACPPP